MKRKKYQMGGQVNNSQIKSYIESPSNALTENDISIAKALYEANTNPLYLGLRSAENIVMQEGMAKAGGIGGALKSIKMGVESIMNDGLPSIDNFFANLSSTSKAYGGNTSGKNIEVEGEEVVKTPNGEAKKVKGPSHERGGIDLFLPDGSEVYSKRISVDGKTMADRKLERDKALKKIQKSLDLNPTDKISKNTAERSMKVLEKEDEMDMLLQQIISGIMGSPSDKAKYGIDGEFQFQDEVDSLMAESKPTPEIPDIFKGKDIKIGDASFGDILSIGGSLYSSFAPYFNTLKNRAADTPNINPYKDFGQNALETVGKAESFLPQQEDNALDDINIGSRTVRAANRASSSSINTMRATDLGIEQQANRAKTDVYDQFATQMMNLLLSKAGLQNEQDKNVMQGEMSRDFFDRQDRDAFNTNVAKNISGIGQGIQEVGKDLNDIKLNDIKMNLLNQLSLYGLTIDSNGNITKKE